MANIRDGGLRSDSGNLGRNMSNSVVLSGDT
jgi:hypothetical protein